MPLFARLIPFVGLESPSIQSAVLHPAGLVVEHSVVGIPEDPRLAADVTSRRMQTFAPKVCPLVALSRVLAHVKMGLEFRVGTSVVRPRVGRAVAVGARDGLVEQTPVAQVPFVAIPKGLATGILHPAFFEFIV
jgi:hypothetical protein